MRVLSARGAPLRFFESVERALFAEVLAALGDNGICK